MNQQHKKIIEFVREFLTILFENSPNFTGNVQLNFFGGGLANITKTQSYKIPKEETALSK